MKYCHECGARLSAEPHAHDDAGLSAMKKNPFLGLLMKPDGTMDSEAPVVLGGADQPPVIIKP